MSTAVLIYGRLVSIDGRGGSSLDSISIVHVSATATNRELTNLLQVNHAGR